MVYSSMSKSQALPFLVTILLLLLLRLIQALEKHIHSWRWHIIFTGKANHMMVPTPPTPIMATMHHMKKKNLDPWRLQAARYRFVLLNQRYSFVG